MSKTASRILSGILVLLAAAVLWALLALLTHSQGQATDWDKVLDLGKKYLGFATSLAGVLGIAIGGSSFVMNDAMNVDQARSAITKTVTGLGVTLGGGAMVGGDPWAQTVVQAAVLIVGGVGVAYVLYKQ